MREQNRLYRERLFQQVVVLLGDKCVRCGYDADQRALQIDHINNNGYKERGGGSTTLYKRVIANPDEYQRLCANCNWIKELRRRESNKQKQ